MTKQNQIDWLNAFCKLWEAAAPSSANNFEDTGDIQDKLTEVLDVFCTKYNLPPMSADELEMKLSIELEEEQEAKG